MTEGRGAPGAIPGWSAGPDVDRAGRRQPAIRDLVDETLATYRRRSRPLLLLSLLLEGVVAMLSLPWLVVVLDQSVGLYRSLIVVMGDPMRLLDSPDRLPMFPAFQVEPGLAAVGGVIALLPLASTLLLSAAVARLLLPGPAERAGVRHGLMAALRVAVPLAIPFAILAACAALVQAAIAVLTAGMAIVPLGPRPFGGLSQVFGLLAALVGLGIVTFVAAVYLAARWAVAVPAMVIEGSGLRAGLARSTALTRGRAVLALLVVVIGLAISWFGRDVIAASPVALTLLLVPPGPVLIAPAVACVAIRVVVAPLPAILVALLYRDLVATESPAT